VTLKEFLDESGLMPVVAGIVGVLDSRCRDELLGRMPSNKIETRLQSVLMETLYPLIEQGTFALSFTYPSQAFLIETTIKSEIQFEVEEALDYELIEDRASLRHEYENKLYEIARATRES
jgi:hypothetical protein